MTFTGNFLLPVLIQIHAISINLCLLGCNGGNAVSAFEHIVRFGRQAFAFFRTILRSFVLISRRKRTDGNGACFRG